MAERRMFAKTIIDSDAFLDMPHTSQLLYFHLAMRADDDGFINNPKSIMRNCKCSEEDLRQLAEKKFIIPFESGIVVIKHWKIHNYIAKDRYKETKYKEEKSLLSLDENNSYTQCIQVVDNMDTQVRLGEVRRGKNSLVEDNKSDSDESNPPEPVKKSKPVKHKYGEYNNVLLTDEELDKLKVEYSDWKERIENLSSYVASTGKSYKSHYATIRNWARKDAEKPKGRKEVVPEWIKNKNNFNDFPQRQYDFDSLEKQMMDNFERESKTVNDDP